MKDNNNSKDPITWSTSITEVINTLNAGGVLLYPTDTIYGLGCDALDQNAVDRIDQAKKRPAEKSFLILAGSMGNIKKHFHVSYEEQKLLDRVWPGAYTCLLSPKSEALFHLKGPTGKVGVRYPSATFLCNLFSKWDGLLISTSANLSGEEYKHDSHIQEELWVDKLDLLVLQKPYKPGVPSGIFALEDCGWKEYRRGLKCLEELVG